MSAQTTIFSQQNLLFRIQFFRVLWFPAICVWCYSRNKYICRRIKQRRNNLNTIVSTEHSGLIKKKTSSEMVENPSKRLWSHLDHGRNGKTSKQQPSSHSWVWRWLCVSLPSGLYLGFHLIYILRIFWGRTDLKEI